MAINITDFDKIWASTSPLTPYAFTDANYQQGWNFVGATPPARQMWDSYMKFSDEKQQYIVNNFLPLSGGTMTGNLVFDKAESRITLASAQNEEGRLRLIGGSGITNGAQLLLSGKSNTSTAGQFQLGANDGTNSASLLGYPNGTLTWGGKSVESVESSGSDYIRYKNGVQICKGYTDSVSSSETTVTYPQPFNSAPQVTISTNTLVNIAVRSITTTTFKVLSASGSNIGVRYIAFGYWE